ncbi:MAG: transposase, partial [Myxococcales bacterium]|nr:transposase [Myxococcales bacterium]
ALELVKSSGRPVAEVARSLNIAEGTLWNWMKAARDAEARAGDPDAVSESERDELRRLRRENPKSARKRSGQGRRSRSRGSAGRSGSRLGAKPTPTCSSSSRSSTTGNATRPDSAISPPPSRLTSGAETNREPNLA